MVLTLAAVFTVWKFAPPLKDVDRKIGDVQPVQMPIREWVLALMLLAVPFVALIAAKIARVGMTQRYMLPCVIGGALIVGALSSVRHQLIRSGALMAALLTLGLTAQPVAQALRKGSLLDQRRDAASVLSRLVPRGQDALPVVISSGLRYLPMVYYTHGDPRLYSLVDPLGAFKFTGSDSVDLALLVLRRYFPLQVVEYEAFSSRHKEFFLISADSEPYAWAVMRFASEGKHIRLVQILENTRVYRVTLAP